MAIEFGKGIALAGGFDLGAKSPLDSRLTVATIEDRDAHVSGNRAYEGMLVYVEADKVTYQYVADADGNLSWKEFGFNEADFVAHLVNDLVTDDKTKGLAASQGVALKALIDAEIERAGGSEEALQAAITALEKYVGTIPESYNVADVIAYINKKSQEVLDAATGGSSESAASVKLQLDNYISENDTKVAANTTAIKTLNGDSTVDGSVDKKVADAINAFATQISDDGTINTYKEILNYIAEHNGDANEMMAAIDALETLVGDTAVATQIANAIAAENLAQYATDEELATAIARIVVLEGATHTHENMEVLNGITAEKIAAWDASEKNSKDYVDEKLTAVNEAVAEKANQSDLDTEVAAREALDTRVGVVEGKAHTHENAEELAKIAEGDVAKWNSIEENATKYTDDEINKIEAIIGDIEAEKTVVQMINEVREACDAGETQVKADLQKYTDEKIAAVNATIGTVEEGKTVVQLINEAREGVIIEAKYDDTQVKADIAKNASDIAALTETHNTDKNALQGNIDTVAADLTALEESFVEVSSEQIEALFPTA